MEFNLADIFEAVADAVPGNEAIVAAERRLDYRSLEERANRLAHALTASGVGRDDMVGLQLTNGTEYIEAMLACFKIRAVPVNVNYRYVARELAALYADAGLTALLFDRGFAREVGGAASIAGDAAPLHTMIEVDDGTPDTGDTPDGAVAYEEVLGAASPDRDFGPRSQDDLYCVYTGGTTGMPKGVVWRHEDIFFAALGGGDPTSSGNWVTEPEELLDRIYSPALCALPAPPFIHASAHWLVLMSLNAGRKIVLAPRGPFDPETVLRLIGDEGIHILVLVGDAMARPLVEELAAKPDAYDVSTLLALGSGGAILSPSTKRQLRDLLPNRLIVDAYGSSETGNMGGQGIGTAGDAGPALHVDERTQVFDEDGHPVPPGSGMAGRLACGGHVPLRYHNAPEKSAETFVEYDGMRWAVPGDLASVDEDGTIVLLGRGSLTINTGGEKVFPDEVEGSLKAHPDVFDCLVVGTPDEKWGEQVTAIVAPRAGRELTLEQLQEHCRQELAGYKVPRRLVLVDEVVRAPSGKADYRWAQARALKSPTPA